MALTERQKKELTSTLQTKIHGECPMCRQRQWTLADEVVGAVSAALSGGLGLGGPYVPMIQLVCANCGFVSHHAVGALGVKLA